MTIKIFLKKQNKKFGISVIKKSMKTQTNLKLFHLHSLCGQFNSPNTNYYFTLQFSTNIRDAINSWNCGTNRWLRMIVYERVPKKYGTILTFTLSAVWHGFYPGYYLTFATGAVFVTSARIVSIFCW